MALAILAVSFMARAMPYPAWRETAFLDPATPILRAHDSYHWLDLAETNVPDAPPPARLLRLAAGLTGVQPALAAFWLPAVLSGLTGLAVLAWAVLLGAPLAGLYAGCMTTLSPMFFHRTGLGYYDTDLGTVLFPLILAWLVAWRIGPTLGCRTPERNSVVTSPLPPGELLANDAWLVAAGLLTRQAAAWHPLIMAYAALLTLTALALVACLGRPGRRKRLAGAIGFLPLAALIGWPALVLPPALALVRATRPGKDRLTAFAAMILALGLTLLCFLALTGQGFDPADLTRRTAAWIEKAALAPGPALRSVAEAQPLPFGVFLPLIHPVGPMALAGYAGFIVLIRSRPEVALLLPLAVLGLAGPILGARVAIFAAPIMALGLCLPLSDILDRLAGLRSWATLARQATLAAMAAGLAVPAFLQATHADPTPVLPRSQAEALAALGKMAPRPCLAVTWWDWGYVTRSFTGCAVPAHGGTIEDDRLASLAALFGAPDSARAETAMEAVIALTEQEQPGTPPPTVFLILTRELADILPWIGRLGDPAGNGPAGMDILRRDRPDRIDPDKGLVVYGPTAYRVSRITRCRDARCLDERFEAGPGMWYQEVEPQGLTVLLDAASASSLTARLLFEKEPPAEDLDTFILVYDDWPQTRIYRHLRPEPAANGP